MHLPEHKYPVHLLEEKLQLACGQIHLSPQTYIHHMLCIHKYKPHTLHTYTDITHTHIARTCYIHTPHTYHINRHTTHSYAHTNIYIKHTCTQYYIDTHIIYTHTTYTHLPHIHYMYTNTHLYTPPKYTHIQLHAMHPCHI